MSARLMELALLFLRLGTTTFGGPAAHIAMMEDEVVTRRQWLTRAHFLDLLGATNLIPGPNSTELAIHIGYQRSGWPGLIVAGVCFIVPAALIVTVLAWMYVTYGALPELSGVLYGVKPVVIAVVAQALWRLGHSAVRSRALLGLGVLAVAAVLTGLNELLVLVLVGALSAAFAGPKTSTDAAAFAPISVWPTTIAAGTTVATVAGVGLWPLFWFFAKVGSVLFGSGYVLLAFLRSGLVVDRAWLTETQLLDAIAIGQVTPGPVFTTATFIGYLLAGGAGALVATLGIFLPAFFFVAVSGPVVPLLRRSRVAGAVLDGVNVASLALMGVVTVQLVGAALVDGVTIALAVVSAALLIATRVNSVWLVLGGAVVGVLTGLR
jgi:chromate transporter